MLTDNRHSIPNHLVDHFAAGCHHWGIFTIRKNAPIGSLVDEIYLYWVVSESSEWVDRVVWLLI